MGERPRRPGSVLRGFLERMQWAGRDEDRGEYRTEASVCRDCSTIGNSGVLAAQSAEIFFFGWSTGRDTSRARFYYRSSFETNFR
jgi:hypothetical protein